MTKPTYQDADVLLKMAQWSTDAKIPDIGSWIWSDEFIPDYDEFMKKYPEGSEGLRDLRKFFMWYETLGTLYKQGLFNGELLFDWMAISAVWKRVEGIALGAREKFEFPRLYENFEMMAKADKQTVVPILQNLTLETNALTKAFVF